MEQNCRCPLLTRSPHSFSHDGAPCGWADLALTCPDCGEEGDKCLFFSENAEENACAGFTRLVILCIRCQLDGAKQRREPQLRQRIVILSGGEASQRGVAFATGHVKTYKDGVKIVDGVWLPQDLSTPETVFFWDRNVMPWRFLLQSRTGAEQVTMRGLLDALGILTEQREGVTPTPQPDVASLAAQVRQLTDIVQQLARGAGQVGLGAASDATADAAAAAAALRETRMGGSATGAASDAAAGAWNPSQTFNLGGQVGSGVVFNQGNDVELAKVLASRGATAEQIMQFLQAKGQGKPPTEHRSAWLQVVEGTSPLCVYTGLHGETRKVATAKVLHVQTQDGPNKLSMKISAWPPARAEDVAVFAFRDIGEDWKRSLVQCNLRLKQITPAADQAAVPEIPTDVDRFLDQLYSCLRVYDHVSVLRAWEAAHHFMVDEVIAKRSQPAWSAMWMMPVFQVELKKTSRGAEGATFDVRKCCVNWNLRKGQKCAKDPDPGCSLLHQCMKCGGEHRICECSRE
jgi:hypothetical protein